MSIPENSIQSESNLYPTSDLGIAVYLFTIGYELIQTSVQGQRLTFHFKNKQDIETEIGKYLNSTGEASARRLFENYRALRALAYQRTGNTR